MRSGDYAHIPYPQACKPTPYSGITANNLIAHAGGSYKGETYLNSQEALNSSYKKGFRLFEIDFIKTSDGAFVGSHDWELWSKQQELPTLHQPDLNEFLFRSTQDDFTPLTYGSVQKWLATHKDAILFTDKIKNYHYIKKHTKFKERLVVETWTYYDWVEALRLGVKKPMFSIHDHKSHGPDEEILRFVNEWKVQYIAMGIKALEQRTNLVRELTKRELCLYVYSSNNQTKIEHHLKLGIQGFYTDHLSP